VVTIRRPFSAGWPSGSPPRAALNGPASRYYGCLLTAHLRSQAEHRRTPPSGLINDCLGAEVIDWSYKTTRGAAHL
jgi:hypothetical protein